MSDWDAVIMHLRATPGEEQLVAANVGTSRIRPLMGKGLKIRAHKTSVKPARFDLYAMQPLDASAVPYRIMTLVEMCSGALYEKKSEDGPNPAMRAALGWLDANPGRWFIVGEVLTAPGHIGDVIGMEQSCARRAGLEVETVNNRIYGRVAHPDGRPLSDFVIRGHGRKLEPLPTLRSDPFSWSLDELRTAASTAREWLLGADAYAQAA